MLITRTVAPDLIAELEQPATRDGWWLVDWPDGRRTYRRSEADAEELAARITASKHAPAIVRRVKTIL